MMNFGFFNFRLKSSDNPYLHQYRAFRRAIRSLHLSYSWTRGVFNTDSIPDAQIVLASLQGVSVENDWLLDVYYDGCDIGGSVGFYIRKVGDSKKLVNEEIPESNRDLLSYLKIEYSREGIWSAYLLSCSHRILPGFWHDCYGKSLCLFSLNEVPPRASTFRNSLKDLPEIHANIEFLDANQARVTAYWWNEWCGLFEENVIAERMGSTVKFIFPQNTHESKDSLISRRVLIPYNCRIML